jgi:hypothetical protein
MHNDFDDDNDDGVRKLCLAVQEHYEERVAVSIPFQLQIAKC